MVVESLRAIGRLIPRKYGHGRRAIGYSFRVRRKELSTGVEEEYAMLVKNGRIIADSHQVRSSLSFGFKAVLPVKRY